MIVRMDAGAITDKRAYEEAVASYLASILKRRDAQSGEYEIALIGEYPDTKLKVAGNGLASGRPMKWEFAVWEFWADDFTDKTVPGLAAMLWANMDDQRAQSRMVATPSRVSVCGPSGR
ncbi:MAG TPA: hypothetical protein VHT27_05805 [Solirubrobacteraceae bacterium]|jgi:hypothetical protein|nr:hypothetical protein [Solirubrobacteraceae bacterium]